MYIYAILHLIINQSLIELFINFNFNYFYIVQLETSYIFTDIETIGLNYSTDNTGGEIIPRNNNSISSSNNSNN